MPTQIFDGQHGLIELTDPEQVEPALRLLFHCGYRFSRTAVAAKTVDELVEDSRSRIIRLQNHVKYPHGLRINSPDGPNRIHSGSIAFYDTHLRDFPVKTRATFVEIARDRNILLGPNDL